MCFVDLEKAFDRVPRKVLEWGMRKKSIPEVMVRAVMSLYEGAKTRVRVGLDLSKEFEAKVLLIVVTENVRNGLMCEMLYMDDLVLTSEMMEGLKEKFWKWKGAFESKGLKVNLGKTKVVVSAAEGEVSVSKVDLCGICGKRVMANSVLCLKCRKWTHGRCANVKRVTLRLGRDFVCGRCKQVDDGLVELVEEFCEEVETARGFCYLGIG